MPSGPAPLCLHHQGQLRTLSTIYCSMYSHFSSHPSLSTDTPHSPKHERPMQHLRPFLTRAFRLGPFLTAAFLTSLLPEFFIWYQVPQPCPPHFQILSLRLPNPYLPIPSPSLISLQPSLFAVVPECLSLEKGWESFTLWGE